jgi:hypothetical protein
VKPPEVLTRDRLLCTYEVRPVLAKVRRTLLGMGVILLAISVLLLGLIKAGTDEDGVYGEIRRRFLYLAVHHVPCELVILMLFTFKSC